MFWIIRIPDRCGQYIDVASTTLDPRLQRTQARFDFTQRGYQQLCADWDCDKWLSHRTSFRRPDGLCILPTNGREEDRTDRRLGRSLPNRSAGRCRSWLCSSHQLDRGTRPRIITGRTAFGIWYVQSNMHQFLLRLNSMRIPATHEPGWQGHMCYSRQHRNDQYPHSWRWSRQVRHSGNRCDNTTEWVMSQQQQRVLAMRPPRQVTGLSRRGLKNVWRPRGMCPLPPSAHTHLLIAVSVQVVYDFANGSQCVGL